MDPEPDPDPYPAIFASDLQDINKNLKVFCLLLLKVHVHHFSKIKVIKKSKTIGINACIP
jgi:hypothetical protein